MKEYISKLYNHGVPVGDLSTGKPFDYTARHKAPMGNPAETAVFEMDDCGFIVCWTNDARALYGYDQEDIIGKHYSILFGTSELREGKATMSLLIAQRKGWHSGEVWQSRKNGRRFLAYFENEALLNETGKIVGYKNSVMELAAE